MSDQLTQIETRHRILRLVRDGATAEEVSRILAAGDPQKGIAPVELAPGTIISRVRNYLERVHREDSLSIEQIRALENIRLDDLEKRLKLSLVDKEGELNLKVVDRLVRLSERRSKMNGLDAAQRHEHYLGRGLDALGLNEEHIQNAERAFTTAFTREEIPDVEYQELPPAELGEGNGEASDPDIDQASSG